MKKPPPEIENRLAALRESRGLSAAELAKLAGVNRQTIYAIEAGNYVPNTVVGLKLARILETSVEDLFRLAEFEGSARIALATPFPGSEPPQPGQPVQLGRVDNRTLAFPPSAVPWVFPPTDAVITAAPARDGQVKVQVLSHEQEELANRIVIAGCDPGISVLARHMQAAGIELVMAHRNSWQSLELLQRGAIHVAGTHLRDEPSGESNLPAISRRFTKGGIAVISFAVWEAGILLAKANPRSIRGVEDFARKQVAIVNREAGSGSRALLDAQLQRLGIPGERVRGYQRIASGHLQAAWEVHTGAADACVSTRAAARLLGLEFIPLVHERYDLAIRRRHLELPGIQTLLETLNRSRFRREMESLGGYDSKCSGERLL